MRPAEQSRDHSTFSSTETQNIVFLSVATPRPIHGTLTYSSTSGLSDMDLVGSWVLVPLSNTQVMGCILSVDASTAMDKSKIKPISALLHWVPALPPSLVELIKYISSYYHVPLGESIKLAMPRWRQKVSEMLVDVSPSRRAKRATDQLSLALTMENPMSNHVVSDHVLQALSEINRDRPLSFSELPFYVKRREWSQLTSKKRIKRFNVPHNPRPKDVIWRASFPPDLELKFKRRSTSHQIITLLRERPTIPHQGLISSLSSRSLSTIKEHLRTLLDQGYIKLDLASSNDHRETGAERDSDEQPQSFTASEKSPIQLTDEQKTAVEQIIGHEGFSVTLLHGVTGSGKTEVYLDIIERAISDGKKALVLVPEIGLTPQTVVRFKRRLKCPIYTWHSQLNADERQVTWQAASNNEPCVLIGARSALFSPLTSLGVIIVDEAHDGSYKQGDGVKYHARDMAVMRGSFERCPVILGTATPSLESMHNALHGKYHLVTLKERPLGASLPSVRVVDLTKSRAVTQEATAITHTLATAISDRLQKREQTVLFLNRRGFSQSIRCTSCGYVFSCPQCLLPLPWHLSTRRLQCHHCDFSAVPPNDCPSCPSGALAPIGRGTERIEQQLASLFPYARVARLDQDSEMGPQELHRLMNDDLIDILIGTQMVTKGHDFPRVTLVGVIDADVGIDLPDFRANERSFQLLSQVSGRAGRAELMGEVIIQSYRPKDERLLSAISHDYLRFFSYELKLRETISYPPFGYLATIRLRGAPSDQLSRALALLTEHLQRIPNGIRARGPSIAPINMANGSQRWLTILSSSNRQSLHRYVDGLSPLLSSIRSSGIHCHIDIDPYDFT